MPNDAKSPGTLQVRPQMVQEFVSGGVRAVYAAVRQALPQFIDDVTAERSDAYDKMLADPTVASAFATLTDAILADGVQIVPAVDMPQDSETADPGDVAEATRAKELADFVQRCLDGCEQSIMDVARELLDGLAFGHKECELVLKPGAGQDAGRLVPRSIKGKNWRNLAYVVDPFMNVQGLLAVVPGQWNGIPGSLSQVISDEDPPNMLPLSKFVIFRNKAKDGDPRGVSVLMPAYLAWFLKTHALPEYHKFLHQFGSPGIIGKTPEGGAGGGFVPQTDEDGRPILDGNDRPVVISAQRALFDQLMNWMNASVVVVGGGTEIDLVKSEGNGEAFLNASDYFDRQITTAILGSTRMTMEAQHGSKADSGTAQDVAGLRVAMAKVALGEAIERTLVRTLIAMNFGEEAMKLCPKVKLAKAEQQDWAKELDAVSKAYGTGFIHDSQLPQLDARLGLPPRDMEAIALEKAEKAAMGRMAAGEIGNVFNPAGGETDEDTPDDVETDSEDPKAKKPVKKAA